MGLKFNYQFELVSPRVSEYSATPHSKSLLHTLVWFSKSAVTFGQLRRVSTVDSIGRRDIVFRAIFLFILSIVIYFL
jgi:hypothetical protein